MNLYIIKMGRCIKMLDSELWTEISMGYFGLLVLNDDHFQP